jgi:phospholipid transport system transporter-binding protein
VIKVERNQGRIELAGVLDYVSVNQLLTQSRAWFGGADVRIDLAGIQHSNSAGLALLLEWLKIAGQSGHQIQYHNVPEQLLSLARAYGIDQQLPIHQ